MKVAYADLNRTEESQGIQRTKTFQIKTNAHAFRILSSGLYSDKIMAVLREIGCNAHDAHLAAGQTRPFEVKLPTKFDNQFYIKDWGIGLSGDEVEGLYTTYFESTKQNSNDFTGAFGLGSKSPFSYIDTFTVTAAKDGVKRVYTAHINEEGSPTVSLMHTGPAEPDWQNGVMVSFPVRPDDFEKFRQRAVRVFSFFNPFPTIIGGSVLKNPTFTEDQGDYAFVTEDTLGIIRNEQNYYGGGGCYIQMGNVVYPLTLANLSLKQNDAGTQVFLDASKNMNKLLVRVPIGKVQVAASREEIQYDADSKDVLSKIVAEIPKKAVTQIYSEFKTMKKTWVNLLSFRKKIHDIHRDLHLSAQAWAAVGASAEEAKLFDKMGSYKESLALPKWDDSSIKVMHLSPSGKPGDFKLDIVRAHDTGARSFVATPDTKLVVGDSLNAYGRTRLALKTDKIKDCILVMKTSEGTDTERDAAVAVLQKNLTFDMERINTSTFDRPSIKKGALLPKLTEGVDLDGKGTLTIIDQVPLDKRVYVVVQRRSNWRRDSAAYVLSKKVLDKWTVRGFWNNIETAEDIVGKVKKPVQFTAKQLKRYALADDKTWKSLEEYMAEFLSGPVVQKALAAKTSKLAYTVDLDYLSHGASLLSVLVHVRHKHPTIYADIEPILAKYGIDKDVETTLADSIAVAKRDRYTEHQLEQILTNFKSICETLDIVPVLPTTKKTAKVFTVAGFKEAAKLDMELIQRLARLDSELLKHVLEVQLKKG